MQHASGVGQGSFYHHFDSKAALASAALASLAQEMCDQFDGLTDEDGLAVARAFLTLERDALGGCRIGRITMEASLADDRIREPITEYFAHIRSRLTAAFRLLDLSIEPEALADLAVAAVQGGYVIARATGDTNAQNNATTALLAIIDTYADRD